MKQVILLLILLPLLAKSQKVEKIFVNLYTDSLKKGTYNYINIDGQLSNGKYIPLDTTYLHFWASDGRFQGNSLWIDKDFKKEKVDFKVYLKSDPSIAKEFAIYIKKIPNPDKLKTSQEILDEMRKKKSKD
jgi:GH43 family beta-xylosidase